MGLRMALVGASVIGMMGIGWGDEPISFRAHAPESLTVSFYAKVYLLPSADSPLLGITEDGGRLPLYRIKDDWSQIGFRNSTGWIHNGHQASPSRWSGLGQATAGMLPASLSIPAFCTAVAGGLMFSILICVLWFASRRRRAILIKEGKEAAEAMTAMTAITGMVERPEPCALEGRIIAHGLAEILQFLELGRRTGMLSVEDGNPAGVINFHEGRITFGHTRHSEGMAAVMEILAMEDGTFHFFEGKQVRQTNCRLSALEVLLHNAHRMDELRNRVYSTGT